MHTTTFKAKPRPEHGPEAPGREVVHTSTRVSPVSKNNTLHATGSRCILGTRQHTVLSPAGGRGAAPVCRETRGRAHDTRAKRFLKLSHGAGDDAARTVLGELPLHSCPMKTRRLKDLDLDHLGAPVQKDWFRRRVVLCLPTRPPARPPTNLPACLPACE